MGMGRSSSQIVGNAAQIVAIELVRAAWRRGPLPLKPNRGVAEPSPARAAAAKGDGSSTRMNSSAT